MFIQVIQGEVADRSELRDSFDTWMRELAPGAAGWLGTTAGVTEDNHFIALARFESAQAARDNSNRPEQHQWWMETAKLFAGDVAFHDCDDCFTLLDGGSDAAGFVQVMQGQVSDAGQMRELTERFSSLARAWRPDIIGGVTALPGNGDFTEEVYFTSEQAARAGETKPPPPELMPIIEQEQALCSNIRYYDLTEPWLYTPKR